MATKYCYRNSFDKNFWQVLTSFKTYFSKDMSPLSSNVYINKLTDIVKKYNNANHRTIKMKPVDRKSKTYIMFNKDNNYKDPKFIDGDYMKISQYKNIFTNVYVPNRSKGVFVVNKVKNAVPWIYSIQDLNGEKIVWTFMKKSCEKQIEKNLE